MPHYNFLFLSQKMIIVSFADTAGDVDRLVRGCGYIVNTTAWGKDSCTKRDSNFIKTLSCQCYTDACNTAQSSFAGNFDYTVLIISLLSTTWINLKCYFR